MWWPRGWGAEFISSFFFCGSSYNLKWTNTCTETRNVHRQTAFGSLYCRKKKKTVKTQKRKVAFPQPQTEKDNAERKKEKKKHLKQNLHLTLQDDFWSSAQARLSDCQTATLRIQEPTNVLVLVMPLRGFLCWQKKGSWITLPIFKRALWLQRWLVLVNDSLLRSLNKNWLLVAVWYCKGKMTSCQPGKRLSATITSVFLLLFF